MHFAWLRGVLLLIGVAIAASGAAYGMPPADAPCSDWSALGEASLPPEVVGDAACGVSHPQSCAHCSAVVMPMPGPQASTASRPASPPESRAAPRFLAEPPYRPPDSRPDV